MHRNIEMTCLHVCLSWRDALLEQLRHQAGGRLVERCPLFSPLPQLNSSYKFFAKLYHVREEIWGKFDNWKIKQSWDMSPESAKYEINLVFSLLKLTCSYPKPFISVRWGRVELITNHSLIKWPIWILSVSPF